jgi:hypothetical protein
MKDQHTNGNSMSSGMLCQHCKKREALVHLSAGLSPNGRSRKSKHYCRHCADAYFARTPGMNSARDLIRLSDFYRSKLYDELESEHPEAFDNSTAEACVRGGELMRTFLRKRLAQDNIKLNRDGLEMLWQDLACSHHFYDRAEQLKKEASE